MSKDQIKILELISQASSAEKVERLLNVLIDEASFADVAEIKTILNDRLFVEKASNVRFNYRMALDLLD